MLIESLAQKTRLAMMTVFAVIGGCTVICAFTVWCCISLVNEERQQIYVLDGDIPFLAERARLEANFTMEAKAHIQLEPIPCSPSAPICSHEFTEPCSRWSYATRSCCRL